MRVVALLVALCVVGVAHAGCPPDPPKTMVPAQRGSGCAVMWELTGTSVPGPSFKQPWQLSCADGDLSCDLDGVQNGECRLEVNACLGMTTSECVPTRVRALRFRRATRRVLEGFTSPARRSAGPACGSAGTVTLPVAGTSQRPSSLTLAMKARSAGRAVRNLVTLGCVDGGPPVCPRQGERGTPSLARLWIGGPGSDLDFGTTSVTSSPVLGCTVITFCLTNCDGTTRPTCEGVPAYDTVGRYPGVIGTPQPLDVSSIPVCLVNQFPSSTPSRFALDTGEAEIHLLTTSDLYMEFGAREPCPVCESDGGEGSAGQCSSSARAPGAPCRVEAVHPIRGSKLSSSCLPNVTANYPLQLPSFDALTTATSSLPAGRWPCPFAPYVGCRSGSCDATCSGESCVALDAAGRCIDSNGGIAQTCCSDDPTVQCFPADRPITRSGVAAVPQPAWPDPTYPKIATGMVLAQTFCSYPPQNLLDPPLSRVGAVILPVDRLAIYAP